MLYFARIARTSQEMRTKFRFLAKNARKWSFLLQCGRFLPKSSHFARMRKNVRFSVIFCVHCTNFTRNVLSFDFGPKMTENGHFCSKNGQFLPKNGHFAQTRENGRCYDIFCAHYANFGQIGVNLPAEIRASAEKSCTSAWRQFSESRGAVT